MHTQTEIVRLSFCIPMSLCKVKIASLLNISSFYGLFFITNTCNFTYLKIYKKTRILLIKRSKVNFSDEKIVENE